MRRREFLGGLGGVAAGWPLAARAKQPAMPVIGVFHAGAPGPSAEQIGGLRKGLAETGYVVDRNVAIEFRWAHGQYDRLPVLAAELVRRQVAVLVVGGGPAPALVAKAATTTIPIVFVSSDDPVKYGLVASLNRPGGNLTGVAFFGVELAAKRFELMGELLPAATSFAFFADQGHPGTNSEIRDLDAAARAHGRKLVVVSGQTDSEFEAIFANLAQQQVDALIFASSPSLFVRRDKFIALAAQHRLPTIYPIREYVTGGGLMSYGNSIPESYRQLGIYAGRILKGAKPSDLPVVQPTKFDLVINLKTAKTLGINVSANLQQRADEVIE